MTRRSPLLVAVALVLAACGKDAPTSSGPRAKGAKHPNELKSELPFVQDTAAEPVGAAPAGSVVLALLAEPDSFNPYLSTSADTDELLRCTYANLMKEDPDFATKPPDFTPYLAERWEFSEDKHTITFFLRKDIHWSDGVPVTADDVRFSWEAAKNPDVAWTGVSIKDHIDDVKVIDLKTVALHFTQVYPYQLMDANDGYIVPRHVFSKIPFSSWKTHPSWAKEAAVCAGPYRIADYTAQQSVTLEANPTYYRKGYPRIPKVTFRIMGSQQTMFDAFLSGGIDVLPSVRPNDVKRVLDDGKYRLFNSRSRTFGYVGYNGAKFPFDDPAVRRALTMATDREDLVESIYLGYADVAYSPIISSMWAHDRSLKPLPNDTDAAAKLLTDRGWKKDGKGKWAKDGKNLAFTLSTNSVNALRVRACTRLQSDWGDFGVDVKIEQVEPNLLSERLRKHDVEAWYGAWNVATKIDEKPTWHSESRGFDGFNWANYVNKRIDEIIDTARTMSDNDKARPLWHEFQRIIHEDQPYTFTAEPRLLNACVKRIRNMNSAAVTTYHNIEEWWLEGGK